MNELFLVAHKVRGEAAFDVAEQMECPICQGDGNLSNGIIDITGDDGMIPCTECDSLGYWWVISTSGHRAYPYWHCPISDLRDAKAPECWNDLSCIPEMPEGLQDHYKSAPAPKLDIRSLFKSAAKPTIQRRF